MSKTKRIPRPPHRHLFKISVHGSEGGNVVLNWRGSPVSDLALIADKYHRAAKLLMKDFTSRHGYNDLWSLPIVFLYRHALELYLKAVLAGGNKLAIALNRPDLYTDNIFDGHGLVERLELLKKVFVVAGWNWDSSNLGLDPRQIEGAIKEFEQFDPQSHTFRYLITKKRKPAVERHFMFSPVQFSQTLDPILSLFSGACMGLEVELEELMEGMGNPEKITMTRNTAQSAHLGDRSKKHQRTRKPSASTQLP